MQIALTRVLNWVAGTELTVGSVSKAVLRVAVHHVLWGSVGAGSYDIAALGVLLCLPTLLGCQPVSFQVQAERAVPFQVRKWCYARLCVAFPCGGHSGIHPGGAAQFLALSPVRILSFL